MNDPEEHLMTVFSAAAGCGSAAEREAYLERVCAGDPALRGRVEALLRAHDRAGGFLGRAGSEETAAFEPAADGGAHAEGLASGTVIAGRYKLLERVGEGAHGRSRSPPPASRRGHTGSSPRPRTATACSATRSHSASH